MTHRLPGAFLAKLFLFPLILIATASVQAQQVTWPLDGPAFSASVQDIRDAAGKITAEKFALVTVLFERDAYVIDAGGRVSYSYNLIYRIEDQAAIDGWSQVAARWEPWFENMPEIHARVIDPSGQVSALDQKTVADGPANEEAPETYIDARIRKAPLPGLKVGSIVEQEIRIVDKQPFFPAGGVYRDYFSRSVPIVREEYLPEIQAAWKSATGDEEKLNLALLLADGYFRAGDGPRLKEISSEILSKYPDSYTALGIAGNADALLKDWKDQNRMLDTHIAKRSDDEILLRLKATALEMQGDYAGSRQTLQKIIDLGKATADDYNNYAWSALFDGKVDSDVTKAAQQAVMLSNNSHFNEIHTLACIYAYQGKTAEARDLLLKAMKTLTQATPNSEVWFGFAMIYEKYGLDDAARKAYSKVEKPGSALLIDSTYQLAQQRLQVLGNREPSKTSLAERGK